MGEPGDVTELSRPGRAPRVDSNVIVGNTAYDGGGIRFCYFTGALPEPTIQFNAVYDNQAVSTGGGVTVCDADVVIANCTIDGNGAGSSGGGVYVTQLDRRELDIRRRRRT